MVGLLSGGKGDKLMDNIQKRQTEILDKLSALAIPPKPPITYGEYCKNIYQAFELGKEYEKIWPDRRENV